MNRISLCVSLLITTSIIAQKTVKWSTSFDETKQVNFNAKIEKDVSLCNMCLYQTMALTNYKI